MNEAQRNWTSAYWRTVDEKIIFLSVFSLVICLRMSLSCPSLLSLQLLWCKPSCLFGFSQVPLQGCAQQCQGTLLCPAPPVPPSSLYPPGLIVLWPTLTPLALLSLYLFLRMKPIFTLYLTLLSQHFPTLPKALSKQPLTASDLTAFWFKSPFSEPTKSLPGIIHWQSWHLHFKFIPFDLDQISAGIWVAALYVSIWCWWESHSDMHSCIEI